MSEAEKETTIQLASQWIASRQTVLPKRLVAPGPDAAELEQLFRAAADAPDHDLINPWRFLIIPEHRRADLGALFAQALLERDASASNDQVAQARDNAALSDMADRPIRWIVDDAAKFVAREVRRERRYDGILLDPPKYGRGPDGEVWRLEEDLPGLIANCRQLLDADSRFLFLTVYAVRMSSLAIAGLLEEALSHLPGRIEHGDLAVREEGEGGRLLPTAIFARWSR